VDLSHRTLLATASLVGIIDRLEKKGLVTRIRSSDDRRAVFIGATEKSRELESEVTPQVVAIQSKVRSTVSEREWAAMEKTLQKVSKALASDHD
jgi:DNA-binding MarR family transcriptional regulator